MACFYNCISKTIRSLIFRIPHFLSARLITKSVNEAGNFTLYFLAYVDKVPESEEEKKKLAFSIPGVLELTQ
jgi:hypothetical protein